MNTETFIIVNPTAGGGLAEKRWHGFENDMALFRDYWGMDLFGMIWLIRYPAEGRISAMHYIMSHAFSTDKCASSYRGQTHCIVNCG